MNTLRIPISVPYRVTGVRRGGRVPRETVCRTTLLADIPVVAASDMPLAVRCTELASHSRRACDYFGYDRGLYCAMPDATEEDGLLKTWRLVSQLSEGARHIGGLANPFARTGPFQIMWEHFEKAVDAEAMNFRTIASDDHDRVMANATRLAADLLIRKDDGRVFRRSFGPHVHVSINGLVVTADDFDMPVSRVHQSFGLGQLEQARAWRSVGAPTFPQGLVGKVEILEPDVLPDHDAEIVARCIADLTFARWCLKAAADQGDEAVMAADRVVHAAARLRGLDTDEFVQDPNRNMWPLGTKRPRPEDLVEAVDTMRSFFEGTLGDIDVDRIPTLSRPCREAFVRGLFGTLDRWDLFVRDALAPPVLPPEIDLPRGPMP